MCTYSCATPSGPPVKARTPRHGSIARLKCGSAAVRKDPGWKSLTTDVTHAEIEPNPETTAVITRLQRQPFRAAQSKASRRKECRDPGRPWPCSSAVHPKADCDEDQCPQASRRRPSKRPPCRFFRWRFQKKGAETRGPRGRAFPGRKTPKDGQRDGGCILQQNRQAFRGVNEERQ